MSEPEKAPDKLAESGDERYRTEQFAFVDEDATSEVSGWLTFMHSRQGRRADRREQARERWLLLAALVAVVALVGGVLLWRPWSSDPVADTGHDALGADRVAVLFQVQDDAGAALMSGILLHDKRDGGRGAAVAVPAELVLPVEGGGRETLRSALAEAGPTLTREALGELLGLELAGSWVLDRGTFVRFVDGLGGLMTGGGDNGPPTRLRGAEALALGGSAAGAAQVLPALAAALPGAFSATNALLTDLGILSSSGLSTERLAAVLAGTSRDFAAGTLKVGALPVTAASGELDVASALPFVRDALGGEPGQGRSDATPRVLVQIGAGIRESDVAADVLNAGFEYVPGGAARTGASQVLVRPSMPDAQALGESIATTLGLPLSVVRLSDEVPFTADVLVVLRNDQRS